MIKSTQIWWSSGRLSSCVILRTLFNSELYSDQTSFCARVLSRGALYFSGVQPMANFIIGIGGIRSI